MTRALPHDVRVAPSILSADFAQLGDQVREVMDAGASVIHCDVMDGQFVPPITIGPLIVAAIADQVHDAGGLVDVHLMIDRPEHQVGEFAKAGADNITFHYEATPHVHYAVNTIREAGCQAGVAICPGTPAESLSEIAGHIDLALCMSVNPGWGGQSFIPSSPDKVRRIREAAPSPVIEVDGGIDADTVGSIAEAGATLYVAGSAVFGAPEPGESFRRIAAAAAAG
jgi:ribulose-phosphate 3-epimerase